MKMLSVVCGLAAALLLTGCASAHRGLHPDAVSTSGAGTSSTTVTQAHWHAVRITPSPKLPKISTWNKLNPIWWVQNADDPIPPDWYRPDEKRRIAKWRFRNPFHNFTFYVVGVADKTHVRYGRYPEKIANPNGGWNFAIDRRRIVFLPFLSYHRGKFDFYFGWRPRGNLGAKINVNAQRPPASKPKEPQSTLPSDSSALPASGP